jgi:Protein of unknown function (DUF1501)
MQRRVPTWLRRSAACAVNLIRSCRAIRPTNRPKSGNILERIDTTVGYSSIFVGVARHEEIRPVPIAKLSHRQTGQPGDLFVREGSYYVSGLIHRVGAIPLVCSRLKPSRLGTLMRRDPRVQLVSGWDTHANEGGAKGQLANLLAPLAQGMAALAQSLGPAYADTAIVVVSEFGRTVAQNGNGGTDHGHGNIVWLTGGNTADGKVHGDWPGLETRRSIKAAT